MKQYLVYQVKLVGPAIAGIAKATAFNRAGTLYVTDTITTKAVAGDVNSLDFFLTSGSPAGSPDAGAIRFATNTQAMFDGGRSLRTASLDLATTARFTAGTLTVTPAATLARQYLYFTAIRSLTASLYQVDGGTATLQFNKDFSQVTGGTLNLSGRAAGYPSSKPVTYRATITGKLTGATAY